MSAVRIEPAGAADLLEAIALLRQSGLPLDGVEGLLGQLLVARDDHGIVGTAGLEVYATGALLRSVSVERSAPGRGVGLRRQPPCRHSRIRSIVQSASHDPS